MMRCFFSSLLTLVLFFNAALTWADSKTFQEIEEFLSHRNVLLSVEFSHASNMLSEDAKRSLDRIAKDIKALTKDSKVVRIEGVITSYSIHYTKLYEWENSTESNTLRWLRKSSIS